MLARPTEVTHATPVCPGRSWAPCTASPATSVPGSGQAQSHSLLCWTDTAPPPRRAGDCFPTAHHHLITETGSGDAAWERLCHHPGRGVCGQRPLSLASRPSPRRGRLRLTGSPPPRPLGPLAFSRFSVQKTTANLGGSQLRAQEIVGKWWSNGDFSVTSLPVGHGTGFGSRPLSSSPRCRLRHTAPRGPALCSCSHGNPHSGPM